MPTIPECAYAAGFFDGEGCVRIAVNRPKKLGGQVAVYFLSVQVGNTDPRVVQWLAETWGGSVQHRVGQRARHKPSTVWHLAATNAAAFLNDILPYLRMKQAQAIHGLTFQSQMRRTHTGHPRTEQEVEAQSAAYERMKILNTRGIARTPSKEPTP